MPLFCDAETTVLLLAAAAAVFVVIMTIKQQKIEVNQQPATDRIVRHSRYIESPTIADHRGNRGIIDVGLSNYRDAWQS